MTQQDKAAPQAAGAVASGEAVSIDTPDFRDMLHRFAREAMPTEEVIAHIDAQLAHQRQEGRRDAHETNITLLGESLKLRDRAEAAEASLEEWRFTNRIDELQRGCDASKASLARLVGDIRGLERWTLDTFEGVLDRDKVGDWIDFGVVLALLPAKAEAPQRRQKHPSEGWTKEDQLLARDYLNRHATPAPAMGEELPCSPKSAEIDQQASLMFTSSEELPPVYGWIQFVDGVKTQNFARDEAELATVKDIFRMMGHTGKAEYLPVYADFRACMALRQPTAEQVGLSDDIAAIVIEVQQARDNWPPFNSAHEGFAVLAEEVDELWDHIKTNQKRRDLPAMRKEAMQVAAMALRFMGECCDETTGRK